jgi:hypothetical protein
VPGNCRAEKGMMKNCEFIGKRDCTKIFSKVNVRYLWGNTFDLGYVTGISKNCICIKSQYCFPLNSNIELLFPTKGKVIDILATVRKYKQVKFLNDTMCVEVLNPSQTYSGFVESLHPTA